MSHTTAGVPAGSTTSNSAQDQIQQSLSNRAQLISGINNTAQSQSINQAGGALSGEASEELMQRMMLEQDAQISLNQSSGAMHTAANQQDFIHQFQHQLHGYHTRQGQSSVNGNSSSNNGGSVVNNNNGVQVHQNDIRNEQQPNNSHAMEMHPGTSTSSQSKQSRTMGGGSNNNNNSSGMPSQQLVAQQQIQGYLPQQQQKMISPGSSGVQQINQGGHNNNQHEGVDAAAVMMEKQQFKQSSVPAAARVRPRSQTGQQVQQKANNMMF